MDLFYIGNETLEERYQIIKKHHENVINKQKELKETLQHIEKKLDWYEKELENNKKFLINDFLHKNYKMEDNMQTITLNNGIKIPQLDLEYIKFRLKKQLLQYIKQ